MVLDCAFQHAWYEVANNDRIKGLPETCAFVPNVPATTRVRDNEMVFDTRHKHICQPQVAVAKQVIDVVRDGHTSCYNRFLLISDKEKNDCECQVHTQPCHC